MNNGAENGSATLEAMEAMMPPGWESMTKRQVILALTPKSGRIPVILYEVLCGWAIQHAYAFCCYLFPRGKLSPKGDYFEVIKPFRLRISLKTGAIWPLESWKYRGPIPDTNFLTVWLIGKGYELDKHWDCKSRVLLVRAIKEMSAWLEERENGTSKVTEDTSWSEEYEQDLELAVLCGLFTGEEKSICATGMNLWKRLKKECGEEKMRAITNADGHGFHSQD